MAKIFLILIAGASALLASVASPVQSRVNRAVSPPGDVRQIDLAGLRKLLSREPKNNRPLLVNFWATWCDPCRDEFPDLVKIDQDYRPKGLDFIAISLDDPPDIKTAVPKFLSEMHATMPVYLLNVSDPEPAIKVVDKEWGGALPATFLYDAEGRIAFKHFGRVKADELRKAIEQAITKK
jgi:thiol-disulfide isomerase/thioredoxin